MAGNHGWRHEPTHRYMSDISWESVFLHYTLSTNQNHQPTEESQNQSGEKNETQSWSNLSKFSQDGSVTCLASTLLTRKRFLGGSPPPDEKIGQLPTVCVAPRHDTHGPWGAWLKSRPVKSINFFIVQEILTHTSWIRLGKPGGSRGSEDLQQQPGGLRGPPGEILL